MIYEAQTKFWGDICVVTLESIMSSQGDTYSVQYFAVKNRASIAIQRLSSSGFDNQVIQKSVGFLLDVRKSLASHPEVNRIPEHLIPGAIVALCVKNTVDDLIDDDTLGVIMENARQYISH